MDEPLRLLDRAFGSLAYPLDRLVPAAVWIAGSILVMFLVVRRASRRPLRLTAYCALAYVLLWWLLLAIYALAPAVAQAFDAPLSLLRQGLAWVLWNIVGVEGSPAPQALFGWPHQDQDWRLTVAGLANESVLVGLIVLGARAALRRRR